MTYFPLPDCKAFKGANFAFRLGLISFLRCAASIPKLDVVEFDPSPPSPIPLKSNNIGAYIMRLIGWCLFKSLSKPSKNFYSNLPSRSILVYIFTSDTFTCLMTWYFSFITFAVVFQTSWPFTVTSSVMTPISFIPLSSNLKIENLESSLDALFHVDL